MQDICKQQDGVSGVRTMSLGKGQGHSLHLKFVHSRIVPNPQLYHICWDLKNYITEMIITTRRYVACKNVSLGQRSRSQPSLKVCALQVHV